MPELHEAGTILKQRTVNMFECVKYQFSQVPQNYWDFVHKYGTIFQSKAYLNFQAVIDGLEPVILVILDGDEIVGGAAVEVGPGIWNFRIGASTHFGPVVANKEKISDVFNCMTKVMKSMGLVCSIEVPPQYAEILSKHNDFKGWVKKELEYLHWDISDSLESLFKAMKKSKREAVRKARREGAIIKEIETPEEVEQFFELYSASMRKGKLEPGSLLYHKNLISMLKPVGLAAGFLALHPEIRKPIAGIIMLLGMHKEATFAYMGHDYEYRKFCAPDLLWWHCLEFLKSKGFVLADLVGLPKGNSKREQGIRDYKIALTGVKGRRYPSFILTRGIFGLNSALISRQIRFAQKCVHVLRKFKGGKVKDLLDLT